MERSTTERGWRLAGLLVLFVIAFFWMPLGARDAAGVSSVIPALGPSTLAQPTHVGRAAEVVAQPTAAAAAHAARRPLPVRVRPHLLVLGVAALLVALVLLHVAGDGDELRPGRRVGALRSRGPPVVL